MRFLIEPPPSTDLAALLAVAGAAHEAGLDGILITQSAPLLAAPLLMAAGVAAEVPDLRIAVELELGERHPVELAEEAAVVDLVSAGRLVLITRPAPGAADAYAEALDLLQLSLQARPFTFRGAHWRVPAELPQNEHRIDSQVRVMPAPAQLRLELWGSGDGRDQALARGLGYLAAGDADAGELGHAYQQAQNALGPALLGAVRARRERLDSEQELVGRLRAGRAAFGQDCAVVQGGAETAERLGRLVLPRVQLHRLPPGLEDYWDQFHRRARSTSEAAI